MKTGKNYGRTYLANITHEDYATMQFAKIFPPQSLTKKNIVKLFEALVHMETVDNEILNQLQIVLNQRKKELSD